VLPFLAATLAAGCSTISDPNVAASVGDAELTTDELEPLVTAVNPGVDVTSADAVRNAISIWLLVETMRASFADDGIEVGDDVRDGAAALLSDPSSGLQGWAELDDRTRDELVEWQAVLQVLGEQPPEYRQQAVADADIEVAPRFGWFDPEVGVLPLGLSDDAPPG
jgi:hypothetical protein